MRPGHLVQGYELYIDDMTIKVLGRIDRKIVMETQSADQAIRCAMEKIRETGGEIFLHAGVFPVHDTIRLQSRVCLRGSGCGTILEMQENHASGVGILCEHVDCVTIADICLASGPLQHAVAGIVLDDCGDSRVRDVQCSGFQQYGIWLRNNAFLCELRGCRVSACGKANIYLDGLSENGRGGDFVPNLISQCVTYGGAKGFELRNTVVANLVACEVFQPGDIAFHLHAVSNSVLLSSCRTFQCETHAVLVEDTDEINISSNIFCWHRGHGIILRNVAWGTVTANEIIDSGVRHDPFMTGIRMEGDTRGIQVTGNAIFNWGDQIPMKIGILEQDTCHHNLIMANNINYCTDADIMSEGRGTLVKDNVGVNENAHQAMGRPAFPDFHSNRITAFIHKNFRAARRHP